MAIMNIASYGLTILVARLLGPSHFGAFAAMMALILVVNVVSLGFQSTAARRVAIDPAHRASIERSLTQAGRRASVVLAALILMATPLLSSALQLGNWVTALPLCAAAVILTLLGTDLGILQGEERWAGFALVVVLFGVSRLVVGAAGTLVSPTTIGAVTGVALGLLVPLVAARATLRRSAHGAEDKATSAPDGILHEALHGTHILFAFFVLSTIDVLLARSLLAPESAGLYAAGLILTKGVLFLPYFVTVIVYPRLAREGSTKLHLWGLAAVFAIGVSVVAVTTLASGLMLTFVGGPQFAAIRGDLWRFALLGTLLAGVQLLVNTALARRHLHAVWWLWGAVVLVVVGARFVHSAESLLTLVLTANAALVLILVLVTGHDRISGEALDETATPA